MRKLLLKILEWVLDEDFLAKKYKIDDNEYRRTLNDRRYAELDKRWEAIDKRLDKLEGNHLKHMKRDIAKIQKRLENIKNL